MLTETLSTMKIEPGKTYELEYEVPASDLADTNKLRETMARIIENIMNSEKLQYVSSKLSGDRFFLRVRVREQVFQTDGNLGVLPAVALYVGATFLITAIVTLGLKWNVKNIREISVPVVNIANSLTPLALIAGAVFLIPKLLSYLERRK